DGSLIATSSQTITPNTGVYPVNIGRQAAGGGSRYYTGTVDDVRMYSRALSAAEVKQLYNSGR
ncbi:hypothetical protein KGP36_07555, partial [Patescibacteria group bacterium]|nr:hypothetical protein [Patescibacteria group bacterium]